MPTDRRTLPAVARPTVVAPDTASPLARLLQVATTTHGAFSRRTARHLGVTDPMLRYAVKKGTIERVAPNAFRVVGSPKTWEQSVVLAAAAVGHRAAASRRCAAALQDFGCGRNTIEITTAIYRTQRVEGVILHSTSLWLREDIVIVDGIRCTDPIRTFIDLGADLSPRRHEELLDSLEAKGIVERAALVDRLERVRMQGRNGVGATARLLSARAAAETLPTNALERRFLRLVEGAGLPRPECQVPIRLANGSLVILDFFWPAWRFGVETDGHGSHALRSDRAHDNRRAASLLEQDIELVRFTWEEVVNDAPMVIATLRRHLQRRRGHAQRSAATDAAVTNTSF